MAAGSILGRRNYAAVPADDRALAFMEVLSALRGLELGSDGKKDAGLYAPD